MVSMTPPQRQPHVVVLGGGSWGTTIASICARRGPTLQWVRSEATAKDINENHRNNRYLGNDVELSETRAVREMSKLGEAAGGHGDTFAGLAGMGDLIVTCTSQRSRNRMSASSSARASQSRRSSHG